MSDRVRCLIVDDEELARESIRAAATLDPALDVVGEAGDGDEAIRAVETLRPDLLFLDIQMLEASGFDVLDELAARGVKLPLTVFVTAHDEHALRGFEAHAVDYLLKPIREDRFLDAVAAARARLAADRGARAAEQLARLLASGGVRPPTATRLPVKANGRVAFVLLSEVEWIASEGNYVRLHVAGESHLMRETMHGIEARLDPETFMRIHRTTIINVGKIQELRRWFTGEYLVRMQSGKELTMTRTYRENLRRLIGK